MSWEVSNLIINDDSGVTITGSRGSLSNVNPSTIFNVYLSDAQSRTRMNPNANTILCGRGNSSAGYSIVFGFTLPTDKTIYIQTDQNDGNVWFWWDGLTQNSDFGTNCGYYRGIYIEPGYTYGFNFQDTGYNFNGGFSRKTINSKTYYAQTWLGFSEQFLPLIWTTIPLSNFVINGERYDSNKSGGAGSGYIGNSLLSNKKMVGYNVPTSSAESTKTESVNEASENPVSGKPKIGNGFARIKFLRDVKSINILPSVVENYYMSSYNCGPDDGLNHISSRCPDIIPYLETDKCICFGQTNKKALVSESSMFKYENTRDNSGSMELIPIGTKRVKHISFKYQKPYSNNPEWNHFILQLVNISNDGTLNEAITVVSDKDSTVSQEWHNISYSCDAEITHIATEGVQSTWYMKDLQIAYVNN